MYYNNLIITSKEKSTELIEKFKINDYDWIATVNFIVLRNTQK